MGEKKLVVKREQAWFRTRCWQEGEKQAESDIRAGRTYNFNSAEEAIAFLHKRTRKSYGSVSDVKLAPSTKVK